MSSACHLVCRKFEMQSDRQRTGSLYVRIQIYLHVTTESFTEIFSFRKINFVYALCYV